LCRPGRCTVVARVHASMGRPYDSRPRLDCVGAGRVRHLATHLGTRWCLFVWYHLDRTIQCTGDGCTDTATVSVVAALSGDRRGAGPDLSKQASDNDKHTGLSGPAVCTRTLVSNSKWLQ